MRREISAHEFPRDFVSGDKRERFATSVDNEQNVGTDTASLFMLNVERGQMFAAETRRIVCGRI